jgi:hypothetical protein
MLYIDFIDTETGKQVFEEGKIIEAQNGIVDTIQLRFNNISKSSIEIIKDIASLQRLSKLRQHAVTCQSKDDFINHLVQYMPEQKWRKQSKRTRRGTDEAFFGLMKVSGHAVLKLIGIKPEDAPHYMFKSIVLKEKNLNRIL